jgi:hypothetical protein
MALTERQKKTIIESLSAKSRSLCPMCGSNNWQLGENLVGAMAASLSGGMGIGGPYVPMAQLICTKCGFVSHHAVGVLGIDLKSD